MASGERPWRIAVDRGGTFTDIVAHSADGRTVVRKVPSEVGAERAIAAIRDVAGWNEEGPIPACVVASVRCGQCWVTRFSSS